jgi:hypothetical protein
MMDGQMSRLDKAKAERERLQTEAKSCRARLSEIEVEIRDIDVFIRGWERFGSAETETDGDDIKSGKQTNTRIPQGLPPESPFYGKGQPGAATLLLQMEGRNMTTAEIAHGLQNHGFSFVTKDPIRALEWALKRAADLGHVVMVDKSLWAAAANPPDASTLEDNRSSRTLAGLELARQRGVRLGVPPKITEDHHQIAVSLFEQGKTIAEIADRCGVSTTALSRHIQGWRREGRFPPERPRGRRKKVKPEDREGTLH